VSETGTVTGNVSIMKIKFVSVFLYLFCVVPVFAQDTTRQIFTPLVNEVIDIDPKKIDQNKVKITNLSQIKINEAPGSVYVVTSEEISQNGYTDLIEVLMDIPGFNIASDVQNGVGIALRGAWTSEAKLLVMVDGLIMNDMSYGSFVVGGRIPLLNVDRIEIIRGASSSIYGGIAGLGVINIITKEGNYSRQSSFMAESGLSGNNFSSTRLTFANTGYLLNDFELSLSGSVYTGNRSNQSHLNTNGVFVNFSDSSKVEGAFLQMNLRRRNFAYKVLYDDYNFQSTYDGIYSLCRTFINDLSYDKKFGKLTFNTGINAKEQIPWNTQYGDPTVYDLQNLKTRRLTFSTNLNFALNDKFNFLTGGVYYNDYMRHYRSNLFLNSGNKSDLYHAFAAFGEISWRNRFVNIFAGGRLDWYQSFNPNFSPRISFTKEFKVFHYKLIYGESFKIPTLQNINLAYFNSEPIKPEKIRDYQAEIGFRKDNHTLILGTFYTQIQDIIVYGYDLQTFEESYVNNGNISFAGAEIALQNTFTNFNLKSSYSYYALIDSDEDDFVADTNTLKVGALGIPKHKFTTRLSYQINNKNTISLHYIFQSSRNAIEQIDVVTDEYDYIIYPSIHLVDLIFQSRNFYRLFDLTAGIKNILNTKNFYSYPISGGYPAIMGMGREFFIQLKINL